MRAAVLGAGTVGSALLAMLRDTPGVEVGLVVDADAAAPGLVTARHDGVIVAQGGLDEILTAPDALDVVFVATNATAADHAVARLVQTGVRVIDLTPAATGVAAVPEVNLHALAEAAAISIVPAAGQASVPLVAALTTVGEVEYAEVVSTIASPCVGAGARRELDAAIDSTAAALRLLGGARTAKSIVIVSPADPPAAMRNRLSSLMAAGVDQAALVEALRGAARAVSRRVPGFRTMSDPVFKRDQTGRLRVELVAEIEGGVCPPYAGDVELVTSAARCVAELLADPDEVAAA